MKQKHYFSSVIFLLTALLFLSCSSDDNDDAKGDSTISKKRISNIIFQSSRSNGLISFFYDSSGRISQIRDEVWDNSVISYYYSDGVVSWHDSDDGREYTALIVDGLARSMTAHNCKFFYDNKRKISEIDEEYGVKYKLTWTENNISKIESLRESDGHSNSIEYTYTKINAHMLNCFLYFNPFTENDFLDCIWEHAIFYTGTCGELSAKLPASAKYINSHGDIGSRTYEYRTDSSGYPISIYINGNGYNYDFNEYPVHMTITWE